MLQLYNTMTRSKEAFRPRDKKQVTIFTCGPSVYRRPHIGNYRTFIYEDILVKYLEYKGYRVKRALPLTDIEDKTILEAIKKNKKIDEITGSVEKIFFSEARSLNIRLPDKTDRASECIEPAALIIQKLMDDGHAYRYKGDIFFDPLTYDGFGKLYRLDTRRWPKKKVRFKRDTYNGNRWNLGDFILWHGYRDGDISWWDTIIGKGRPSWNIQDPAVAVRRLGGAIDINCGGIDNMYRHHDYNIAIIESYTGKTYAKYYLHGEHLVVDGKPMSKSRGNILYPADIYCGGCTARDLRFFLFYGHYRARLNFTRDSFKRTCAMIGEFRARARQLVRHPGSTGKQDRRVVSLVRRLGQEFERSMDDDLNTGSAFDAMSGVLKELQALRSFMTPGDARDLASMLKRIDTVLGAIG